MQLQQNISLKNYNTFGIDAYAKYFVAFTSIEELRQLLSKTSSTEPLLILGGGSNLLLTQDFKGTVLKNETAGITLLREDEEYYYVEAAGGENWHKLVLFCVAHNYAGMENLSLIPGSVGASPIQNIGAYGVELKDVFYELQAYDLQEHEMVTFTKTDCSFGYRESVFKQKYKGRFVIVSVTFKLRKEPIFHTEYGAIGAELDKMNISTLSISAISEAVIRIRKSKLPDPSIIGNAGSFFKNPTVCNDVYFELKHKFPTIAGYATDDNKTKLAAGWLIEQCGWKGYRNGDAGCYDKQALVLVNYGKATGADVLNLSAQIIESVQQKFGVTLEREVNLI